MGYSEGAVKPAIVDVLGSVVLVAMVLLGAPSMVRAGDDIASAGFDDSPLQEPVENPDWFKLSFLDLHDDLQEALDNGKQGLVLYFGQKYCPYCKALMERNFGKADIVAYTRRHFDVVAIDVRGNRPVTDLDGTIMPEKQFAGTKDATFTPTLVFYGPTGQEIFRLVGYYPPYEFRAALEYVADKHYRDETFRHYLARAEPALFGERSGSLIEREFFDEPPYALNRSLFPAPRPLVVVFEQANCHACDVLHAGPLSKEATIDLMHQFQAVQLDMWSATPVLTPSGRRRRAREWAEQLGLFYAPTLIFFNEQGEEIIRVASVAHFNRLRNVMRYVLEQGYKEYGDFQSWRQRRGDSPAAAEKSNPTGQSAG